MLCCMFAICRHFYRQYSALPVWWLNSIGLLPIYSARTYTLATLANNTVCSPPVGFLPEVLGTSSLGIEFNRAPRVVLILCTMELCTTCHFYWRYFPFTVLWRNSISASFFLIYMGTALIPGIKCNWHCILIFTRFYEQYLPFPTQWLNSISDRPNIMSTQTMLKWDSFVIWSSQVEGWYRVRLVH